MKITEAQRRNLEHVRDHGCVTPRSRAGYNCRIKGLSEWVWLLSDGSTQTSSEVDLLPRPLPPGLCLVRTVCEVLTPAGRAALSEQEERDG